MAQAYYRADGVRITHDPYAPGMVEKYGKPGATDGEGFDPYADTVGPGIYGGRVRRDGLGSVVVGTQYQNHNPRPGPIYAGGGYTPVNEALRDPGRLEALLAQFPDLANDVSTGGATPLHMCGMGGGKAEAVALLLRGGGDVEALDTYGFTPLHRMASNNLPDAAAALLAAGADPFNKGACGQTPLAVAQSSAASDFVRVLRQFPERTANPIAMVRVLGAGVSAVDGDYEARDAASAVPEKFASVCEENGWDTWQTWARLSGVGAGAAKDEAPRWFEAPSKAYIYFNVADGHWWMDGPDGLGVYKAQGPAHAVPAYPRGSGGALGWFPIEEEEGSRPVPSLLVYRRQAAAGEAGKAEL